MGEFSSPRILRCVSYQQVVALLPPSPFLFLFLFSLARSSDLRQSVDPVLYEPPTQAVPNPEKAATGKGGGRRVVMQETGCNKKGRRKKRGEEEWCFFSSLVLPLPSHSHHRHLYCQNLETPKTYYFGKRNYLLYISKALFVHVS